MESMILHHQSSLLEQKKILIFIIISFVSSTIINFLFDLFAKIQLDENDVDCEGVQLVLFMNIKIFSQ